MKHLYESILDDDEDLLDNNNSILYEWAKNHCEIYNNKWQLMDYKFTPAGKLHIDNNSYIRIIIRDALENELPFEFDNDNILEINISNCNFKKLTNKLPKKIGYLNIENCNNLIYFSFLKDILVKELRLYNIQNIHSFKYIPKNITSIDCIDCINLDTLDGLLNCNKLYYIHIENSRIKNLKGSPTDVTYFEIISCKDLLSLEGAPKTVDTFRCIKNLRLKNLKGCPEIVDTFECLSNAFLNSLYGLSKNVNTLICTFCTQLKSLKYAEHVKSIDCYNCDLIKFDYIKQFKQKYNIK